MMNTESPIVNPEDLIPQEDVSSEIKDPRYISIGALPSGYSPYNYNDLFIRPFAFADLKLVSRAAQTKTTSNIVNAVNKCIDQDAFDLTVGDFYYVLFWLRLHSYPKTPWIVEWTCRNIVKRNGEDAVCGAENFDRISQSSIEVLPLKNDVLPEGIDYPRARHLDDIQEMVNNPELRYLIKEIQWVEGHTMQDKIQNLENSNGLDLFEQAKTASDEHQHGILETITMRCKECGGLYSHKMTINPLTFFR